MHSHMSIVAYESPYYLTISSVQILQSSFNCIALLLSKAFLLLSSFGLINEQLFLMQIRIFMPILSATRISHYYFFNFITYFHWRVTIDIFCFHYFADRITTTYHIIKKILS